MVNCCAIGCSNRSENGFSMRKFPTDSQRRKLWIAKVKREGWKPTTSSAICEAHFEETMWEKARVDGKKKLKCNAVPTLFAFVAPQKIRKAPINRATIAHDVPNIDLSELPQQYVGPLAFPSTSSDASVDMTIPFMPLDTDATLGEILDSTKTIEDDVNSAEKNENILLHKKLEQYEKAYTKIVRMNRKYKAKIYSLQRKKNYPPASSELLKRILNPDQIMALSRNSTKFMKWSNATVKNALKLKFSCDTNGYKELLRQKIPLPSLRTLRRRLQGLKFDSGVLDEVFNFLKIKVDSFSSDHERDCVIVLDEMAITPASVFDMSLNQYVGHVTLPNHSGEATHALVIMLGGVTSRWKQTVAYYFTGDSVNGSVFGEILNLVIEKTEALGLIVVSITSDMGGSNQALWRKWGIKAGRHARTKNCIPHPLDPSRKIYILADVPHLFKNIKSMLINNKIITLAQVHQLKYNLPTNIVDARHFQDLVDYQDTLRFKLAPKLSQEVLTPSHFQTMKVSTSTHVISHDVSSGLKFLAEQLNKPEYLTTAWFIDRIEEWFVIMTSRHPTFALSKVKPEKYEETINNLKEFMEIFSTMSVGEKNNWKPSQTGVIISTQTILDLQEKFLNEKGYHFLLTSRFTQDCLENLFSIVRSKQVIHNASQFKNNLKLICVSQFLADVSKSSYDKDDREFLADFLNLLPLQKTIEEHINLNIEVQSSSPKLSYSELNSLYNICGYIISSIKKTRKVCNACVASVGSNTYDKTLNYANLSHIKCFSKSSLFFCNNATFEYFAKLENIFIKYWNSIKEMNINVNSFYMEKMKYIEAPHITNCHNLKKNILSRFLIFRLKIAWKKKFRKSSNQVSKSMAMHNI